MPQTTVVAPCFDEARRLPLANCEAFVEASPDLDFPFVTDSSTDKAEDLLRRLEERDFAPAVAGLARIYRLYR